MSLLNLLRPNPCKEMEAYFKETILPQFDRVKPYVDTIKWSTSLVEDDRIRPLTDCSAYLVKGKKFKPGKVYSTTFKRATGDKSACFFIEDIGAVYSIDQYKKLSNIYAYAKNETDVFLFVWK